VSKGYVEKDPPRNPSPPKERQAPAEKPQAGQPKGPKTTYKVYGKKGPASVHTRFKGVAYGPTQATKFRSGQQARVSVGADRRASVTDPSTDHTQTWDPIPEAFCTLVGDMIVEAMSTGDNALQKAIAAYKNTFQVTPSIKKRQLD